MGNGGFNPDEVFVEFEGIPGRVMIPPHGIHVSCMCSGLVMTDIMGYRVQSQGSTWQISGQGVTNGGTSTIRINDFLTPLCTESPGTAEITDHRPLFMATANSADPIVVTSHVETTGHTVTGRGWARDLITGELISPTPPSYTVDVTIRSWNLAGDPIGVPFSWLCIAEGMTWEREV